jgi:hypothetical protein
MKKRILAAVILIAVPAWPQALSAFRPAWNRAKRAYECRDTSGRKGLNKIAVDALLESRDGACADLKGGVILSGADLTGADLRMAVLVSAELSGTRLNGARLEGADLRGAVLTAEPAYLRGAVFDGKTRLPSDMDRGRADLCGMIYVRYARDADDEEDSVVAARR